MTIEDKIMIILGEICGAEEGELEPDMDLFDAGLLDSFGVIQLLVELEEQFGVHLEVDLIPRKKIATPQKIAALIKEMSE